MFHQQKQLVPLHLHAFPAAPENFQSTVFPQVQYRFSGGKAPGILLPPFRRCGLVLAQCLQDLLLVLHQHTLHLGQRHILRRRNGQPGIRS